MLIHFENSIPINLQRWIMSCFWHPLISSGRRLSFPPRNSFTKLLVSVQKLHLKTHTECYQRNSKLLGHLIFPLQNPVLQFHIQTKKLAQTAIVLVSRSGDSVHIQKSRNLQRPRFVFRRAEFTVVTLQKLVESCDIRCKLTCIMT